MWISVEIPTKNSTTMMVAAVNGDPPPPEHIHYATCVSNIIWDEKESKHPNASFLFTPNLPGTKLYDVNTIEKSSSCRNSNHEPPLLHQPRPHLCLETSCDYSNASPLSSTRTITLKNMKNTKTNHTTTPNKHTSIDHNTTPTRQPPPFQPSEPTHATPPPYLPITVPP